jgi:GNAT superfamily N-acetyltransferase
MYLPDLLPDVQFHLLPQSAQALRYAFEAKRVAMGPYIEERWGWDEALQMKMHQAHFGAKPFFKIVCDGRDVGTVSVMKLTDHIRFGEFYLFPDHQRKGLGTRILRHFLALADEQGMPVRLEHLKWNPVGTLYRRHGFIVVGDNEIHWFMERPPLKPSDEERG